MKEIKKIYDVAVIGAGPAGMMAAIAAAENGAKVVLIEKNESAGKKLLLTGGGRCNLSNARFDSRDLVANYDKEGPFLFHAFAEFGSQKTIDFFNSLGVRTAVENNRRVLTKSGQAQEILDALLGCLKKFKVKIIYGAKVREIKKENNLVAKIALESGAVIIARNYIIATGGKSYSATGSTGDGYGWAAALGHKIVKPAAALAPVIVKETWVNDLAGVALKRAGVKVFQNGKKIIKTEGEILFTHFGLSGPVILNISARIGELLKNGPVEISLNLISETKPDQLEKSILKNFQKNPNKILKNCLADFVPSGMASAVAQIAGIGIAKTANNITKEERGRLVEVLQNLKFSVAGLPDLEIGMITAAGVDIKEIDHKTMRSKIISNLFFAGEIINVHGATGGFNLQQCWSTGHLAGKSVAEDLNK